MDAFNRRSFLGKAAVGTATLGSIAGPEVAKAGVTAQERGKGRGAAAPARYAIERCATEWAYSSGKAYRDPFMAPFDPRGANEAGFPWEENYARINPRYFDTADIRIQSLVEQGLVPCIVGCWGHFLPYLGLEKNSQPERTKAQGERASDSSAWGALDGMAGTPSRPQDRLRFRGQNRGSFPSGNATFALFINAPGFYQEESAVLI